LFVLNKIKITNTPYAKFAQYAKNYQTKQLKAVINNIQQKNLHF